MSSNSIKKKFFLVLNYHIRYIRIPLLFLILITLVFSSSSFYLLPSTYSQEVSFISIFRETGAPEARLERPEGVAVDPSTGNVYVADTPNHRIVVFSNNGTFITAWGEFGTENGMLRSPEGVAVDPSTGNVYVTDTVNNRIQEFSSNGTFILTWGERRGITRDGALSHPQGIAVDQQGNVYVADTGSNRIQVFSNNGTFKSKFPQVWGEFGTEEGTFTSPEDVAVDPSTGNVYVTDTANNRIQVFSNGTFITAWGEFGTENGMLRSPEGVAVDPSTGNVYVADTANHRIQVFSSNGTFISQVGTFGLMETGMRFPGGVAVDPSTGNVYVADTANNRILGFASRSPPDISFSSKDGEVYGNNTRIKLETIYEGLRGPTAITFLGPDDMLVLQRSNETIMRIVNGQMLDEPVLDLGNTIRLVGDSCICSIAILQNDNGTSYAFLYYIYIEAEITEVNGTKKFVNRLYRYDLADGKLTNPELIFEMPTRVRSNHNGGKVMIGPDNNVYLTIGDLRNTGKTRTQAQNLMNGPLPDGSSSILRFTPDGEAVDGGLFGDTHPLDKYYAYGIRNSFGLDYDPITGNIWMTDNGPIYGDELNLANPGFNGGWNEIMGFSSLSPAFNLTDLEYFNGTGKYYDPIFEWLETIGVTDLVFVPPDNNKLGKEYDGNLFVGEYNSGYLYRFFLNQSRTGLLLNGSLSDGVADNNIEKLEAAFASINGAINDLEIGPDGLLYIVVAAGPNGKIMRLEPIGNNVTLPLIEETPNATETDGGGDIATGVSIVSGSSSLTDTAYQPNPVQVHVYDTVRWTNDDTTPHTVTSGQNGEPDGQFDSGTMAPQQMFEHTFTAAGEYPYFCILHPNMVGTVSVS